ncbi:NAD(P)-dependent alcohol dehydrogenase [Conexibacter sp. S30A1]|uniref:NAD(P)-dependent alcohol dehydrogenase n=1 Tax=Conexibacter sp. S30A1 TaxID=2937800 RepID=UPI00200C80C7|nr:NAD(P)-dependent alcohol dehydrogenase [Conexibacter sp. S30A1]
MFKTNALVTKGPKQGFRRTRIERRDVGRLDVLIDIAYCGICHSDVSYVDNEWGRTIFPLVPGHEIAGVVSAVGSDVTRFSPGDRVGVGCLVDTCGECHNCLAGHENHCQGQRTSTYSSRDRDGRATDGGYSEQIVVTEDFVVRIPETLSLETAAPLLCAGITVYSPLTRWGAGPGTRVGVLGLGGLGHVALQIARALGARTTVFDLDPAKRDDALRLGADAYITATDSASLEALASSLDLMICTVPANLDLNTYLAMLDVDGKFVVIGVPSKALTIDAFSLIINQRALAGSRIGNLKETQQMLDFCAAHQIGAEVEVISADEVERAYGRVRAGDVRFRFVLDTSTIRTLGEESKRASSLVA